MMLETLGTKLLMAFGAALLVIAAWGAHALQVSHLREQVTKAESARDRAVASARALAAVNDDFSNKLAVQNRQVAALQAAGAAREQTAAAATAAARLAGAKGQAAAQAALKRGMAKPGDACGSLDSLLSEAIRGAQ